VSSETAAEPARDVSLDGLRGVAILLVVLYHATLFGEANAAGYTWFIALPRLGWSGVDLFFVLSGFLITRILLRNRDTQNYFRVFYARRVLRIFPLYYAVLVVMFVVVPRIPAFAAQNSFWLPGPHREFWYWLYLSNLKTALLGGFDHRFLGLTWSLAIEEQFYLVWPLLVWWLSRGRLSALCAAAAAAALGLRCWFVAAGANPFATYVLTPMRMDCLAIGALVALVAESKGGWPRLARIARVALPAAGAACALVVAIYTVDPSFLVRRPKLMMSSPRLALLAHPLMQTVGYSALAIFYAALLVRAMPGSGRPLRILESRPLLVLGRYSYAIYLLHVPAVVFVTDWLRPRLPEAPYLIEQLVVYALVLAIALGAARLSWLVLEEPALRLGHRFRYRAAE
jgi:peptidoglycan/LPS O-acetylase OafA/YrhL